MDMDCESSRSLVRPWRLLSRFCSSPRPFAPHCLQASPRGDALVLRSPSPPSGWQRDFHPPRPGTCPAHVSVPPAKRVACWVGPSQRRLVAVKISPPDLPPLVPGYPASPLPARRPRSRPPSPVPSNARPYSSSPVTAQLGRTLSSRERWGSQRQEGGRWVFADRCSTGSRQEVQDGAALLAQGGHGG
jgi:hypothetical protein